MPLGHTHMHTVEAFAFFPPSFYCTICTPLVYFLVHCLLTQMSKESIIYSTDRTNLIYSILYNNIESCLMLWDVRSGYD